jgi:hypothetical protein
LHCRHDDVWCLMFYLVFSVKMRNMQSAAHEHSRRIVQETDLVRKHLD